MVDESGSPGRILKAAREEAGVQLSTMAARTGYSYSYLANLERGAKAVKDQHIAAYQRVLCIDGGDMKRRTAILAALGSVAGTPLADELLRSRLLDVFGVNEWPDIADQYGRLFMVLDGDSFRRQLAGDLIVITDALKRSQSDATTSAAARMITLYAAEAGSQAAKWYDTARIAAQGQTEVTEWITARQVFRASYEGIESQLLLRQAATAPGCEARLAEAHARGRLGDRRGALACLDHAQREYRISDQAEDTIYALPAWRMAVASGYVHALVGDVNSCENELSQAAVPSEMAKWHVQADMVRAVAVRQSGDRAHALHLAEAAFAKANPAHRNMVVTHLYGEATRGA